MASVTTWKSRDNNFVVPVVNIADVRIHFHSFRRAFVVAVVVVVVYDAVVVPTGFVAVLFGDLALDEAWSKQNRCWHN